MTVPAQDTRVTYTASGSSDTFAYPFLIQSNADLLVYVDDVEQTLTTDYTVTGVGTETGGNVVFTSAPAASSSVVIMRDMAYERTGYDYQNAGNFSAETINADLDALAMQIQQLAEKIRRAPLLSVATVLAGLAFPSPGAGQYIRWNNSGTALETAASVVDSGLFIQSGADAIERYMTAKAGDIVDGRDFGVVGNGVADDTLAIQATLNAAPANSTVYFTGVSIISDTITPPRDNVRIVGRARWVAAAATNFEYMFFGTGRTGVVVEHIEFDANKSNRSSGQTVRFMCAGFQTSTDCGFENVTARGARGYGGISAVGLVLSGCTRGYVENCKLIDCGDSSYDADGVFTSGTQNTISNSRAHNCTDTAFVIENSDFSIISGCSSYNCAAGAAVTVAGSDNRTGNAIAGLTVRNWDAPSTGGIQIGNLSGAGNLYDTSISGVVMYANTGAGYGSGAAIWVRKVGTGEAQGVEINGVEINGATYGVRVDDGDNVTVRGTIKGVSSAAVYFAGGIDHAVKSSHLQGGDYGVLTANASECDAFGNTIRGQAIGGITALNTSTVNNWMNSFKSITGVRVSKDAGATINSMGHIATQPVLTSNVLTNGVAGTLAKKIEVYDHNAASQGYLYLYDT